MIILTMALLNFFSRLTYENILSPMILARSGNNHEIQGAVNAAVGAGGIVGGLIVSSGRVKGNSVRMIYVSAMFSFLLGDVMMGVGRTAVVWSLAAATASLPIAFINAGQTELLYRHVPGEIQGRIFAVRNALQFGAGKSLTAIDRDRRGQRHGSHVFMYGSDRGVIQPALLSE